jgi:hypothetical protein
MVVVSQRRLSPALLEAVFNGWKTSCNYRTAGSTHGWHGFREVVIRFRTKSGKALPEPGLARHSRLGNWLRHQYDRFDLETIWHAATVDAPALRHVVKEALQQRDGPEPESRR